MNAEEAENLAAIAEELGDIQELLKKLVKAVERAVECYCDSKGWTA